MHRSDNINDLLQALAKAKMSMASLVKTKKAYNYSYAPLDEVLAVVEKPLLENNLVISHDRNLETNAFTTYLFHVSGQYIATSIKIEYKADNKLNFMQSLGSASTYAMRYNIIALLNLAAEDDDDGVATAKPAETQKPATKNDKPMQDRMLTKEEQQTLVDFITSKKANDLIKQALPKKPSEWTMADKHIILSLIPQG